MNSTLKTLLIFCLLFLAKNGNAQIVNIETKRLSLEPDTSGWFGNVDAGFSLNENNKTVLTFTGNANLEYLNGKNLWISLTNYRFLIIDDESFLNSGFQHFRYNRQLKKNLSGELFTQIQYNEQLRIKVRGLAGIGPRFHLLDRKTGHIFLGTLYMYQYEELNKDNITHRDHRLSAYLRLSYNLTPNAKIYSTSYYQPLISKPSIVRLSSQTALNLKISAHLSFSSSFSISADSRLSKEANVPVTTYSLANNLKWKF